MTSTQHLLAASLLRQLAELYLRAGEISSYETYSKLARFEELWAERKRPDEEDN